MSTVLMDIMIVINRLDKHTLIFMYSTIVALSTFPLKLKLLKTEYFICIILHTERIKNNPSQTDDLIDT